jgi:very-short-patch-repair endonuclease
VSVDGVVAVADFAWPEHRLIVEIDGREWHTDREAFQRDRRRQNALIDARWRVLRFTVDDVRLYPEYVIEEICKALWG